METQNVNPRSPKNAEKAKQTNRLNALEADNGG